MRHELYHDELLILLNNHNIANNMNYWNHNQYRREQQYY